MTRGELLDALLAMPEGQLELIVGKFMLSGILPGRAAPQAMRAVDLVRYLEAQNRLSDLDAMLQPPATNTPAAPQISIARLPATSPDLFGRAAELAWLDACWQNGTRVASIIAFGGIGKSALVNTWLARMDTDGWRGAGRVYGWSFYSQGTDRLSSSDEFIDAALRWFGDPDPTRGSAWDRGERLAALVRKERTILVLDGLEPLQWGPGLEQGKLKEMALRALVKELAAQNPGLCVITSRIGVADLEALGANRRVEAHNLDHLSDEAGAELLRARGAKGLEEELRAAAREYKGHGLALTLLGSYLRKRYKGDIRQRAHIPLLEGEPAQRMMWAYERWFAGKPEIAVLRLLGLFDRPAKRDETDCLLAKPLVPGLTMFLKGLKAGVWNEAVTTLQDVGMLAVGRELEEGIDAHPLVREHFAERLRRDQPDAWREGHRRLFEHLTRTAKPLPDTVEQMAALYSAVVHGSMAGKHLEALEVWWNRIKRGDEHFSAKRLGSFGSEVAVLSAFFHPPWERLVSELSEQDQAYILNEAGFALRALGRLTEAAGLLRQSIDMAVAQGNWRQAALRASNLTELLQSRGELSDAMAQARKSVEFANRDGDAFPRIRNDAFPSIYNKTTLAAVLHAMGLQGEAAAQFAEAERIQKEKPQAHSLFHSVQGFRYCDFLLAQGQIANVRERAAHALKIDESVGDVLSIALDHLSLGRSYLLGAANDLPQAASHLDQAIDGLHRASQQDYLLLGLLARAALHTHTRDFPAARRDLDEALTLAERCGFRLHEADAHLGHARLGLAEGHREPAREHLRRARVIINQTGYHRRNRDLSELQEEIERPDAAPPAAKPEET